jgi:hypothetical protein
VEFNTNALSAGLIRRMANEVPDLFVAAAQRYLDSADESAAHRFLTSLMLRQDCVFDEVADPARGPLQRSINLFSRLCRMDTCFDVKLARKLPDRAGHNHAQAFDRGRCCRVLDVLNETSIGRRLIPILKHLVDSPDSAIAAKATLFIGRRIQSPEWAARQIARENPENVRAKAIESLWGVKSQSARDLLEDCATDESVRVAGNALVGLHKLGKPGIMDQIAGMVNSEEPGFRTTAAWTMGKIGHSSFADPLTGMLKDESAEVRSAALQSLLHLRKVEAAAREEAVKNAPPAEPVALAAVEAPVEVKDAVEPGSPEIVKETPLVDIDIRLDGSTHATRSDRFKRSG